MKELIDKAVVIAGSSTTAISGGTAVKIDGSMINGLLNSTLGDVMTGQFTWYMSDVVTLVSLSATLTMVFWRIKQDKKKDNE